MNKIFDCIVIREFDDCLYVVAETYNESRHTKDITLFHKNNQCLKNRNTKVYEKLSGLKII